MSVSTDRHQSSLVRQQHDYCWDNVNNWKHRKLSWPVRKEGGNASPWHLFGQAVLHSNQLLTAIL